MAKVIYLGPSSMITYRSAPSRKVRVFLRGEEIDVDDQEDIEWFKKRGGFKVVTKKRHVEEAKKDVVVPESETRPDIAHLPKNYKCTKCGNRHKTKSKVGKSHLKYRVQG